MAFDAGPTELAKEQPLVSAIAAFVAYNPLILDLFLDKRDDLTATCAATGVAVFRLHSQGDSEPVMVFGLNPKL